MIVDIEVSESVVLDEIKFIFTQIRFKVKIDGFRQSSAPMDIIEKKFFCEVRNRAVEKIIKKTVLNVLKKENFTPIGLPVIEDFCYKFGQPLRYRFVAECHSIINVKDYKGIPVIKEVFRVTDESLNENLDALRNRNAKLIPSKLGKVTEKSVVYVDYIAFDSDGKIITDVVAKNHVIDLGLENTVRSFKNSLIASRIGDEKDVKVEYSADYPNKIFAGKKIIFKIKIVGIKEKKILELNDNFAKNIGYENLGDLKLKLRKTMEDEQKLRQNMNIEKQIVDYLLEKNVFEVPQSLVMSQKEILIKRVKKYMSMHGVPKEYIKKQIELGQRNFKKEAEKNVRLFYILNAIQTSEKLIVTECDVDTAKYRMNNTSISNKNITVDEYFKGEKIFDFLLNNANIRLEEKAMSSKKLD